MAKSRILAEPAAYPWVFIFQSVTVKGGRRSDAEDHAEACGVPPKSRRSQLPPANITGPPHADIAGHRCCLKLRGGCPRDSALPDTARAKVPRPLRKSQIRHWTRSCALGLPKTLRCTKISQSPTVSYTVTTSPAG